MRCIKGFYEKNQVNGTKERFWLGIARQKLHQRGYKFSMFNSQLPMLKGEGPSLIPSLHPQVQRLIAHGLTHLFAVGKE
jgi:hypothetical protein